MPCSIDGVVFFKTNPEAILKVEKFNFAITQLAQAAFEMYVEK
jgi:hypothetical protein